LIEADLDGQAVVLAALLHDIGAFRQRADQHAPGSGSASGGTVGAPMDDHAAASATCFGRVVPPRWQRGRDDVASHHQPQNYTAKLVAVADRLSAGGSDDEPAAVASSGPSWLVSIFSRVGATAGGAESGLVYAARPLALERATLYPRAQPSPGMLPLG
jgi:hypothetical protein